MPDRREDAFSHLDPALRQPLLLCARGEIPPNVALMRLLMGCVDQAQAKEATSAALEWVAPQGDCLARRRLDALAELWRSTPDAYIAVQATLACAAQGEAAERANLADRQHVARWAQAFDRAAQSTGDCAVALYALGRADLLAAATTEVMQALERWKLVKPGQCILDIGCGSGRFLERLAPSAAIAVGIDVSRRMLRRAYCRCCSLPRACLVATSGRDLAAFRDRSFDVALAVDSFPYVVSAGLDLVETFVAETARVLKSNGVLVILNYSYRNDPAADDRDVAGLAGRKGFEMIRNGSCNFSLWDARAYLLRRR